MKLTTRVKNRWRYTSTLPCAFMPCTGTILPTNQHTNSMEQSLSWEATTSSTSQEIPGVLCNPKVRDRLCKCPPFVPVLSLINPLYAPSTYSLRLISGCFHPCLGLLNGLLPSRFPIKTLYAPHFSTIHATCSFQLIVLDWLLVRSKDRSNT